MTVQLVESAFPIFIDLNGDPLENGFIYIGVFGLNPITNPINVFYDEGLNTPVAQPIRTIGGYPAREGKPAQLYVNSTFSTVVQNQQQELIFSSLSGLVPFNTDSLPYFDALDFGDGSRTAATINAALTSLAGANARLLLRRGVWVIDAAITYPSNITLVIEDGVDYQVSTAITSVVNGPRELPEKSIFSLSGTGLVDFSTGIGDNVNPRWWGATGDGSTDDSTAIQQAVDSFGSNHGIVQFDRGIYQCAASLDIKETRFVGTGTSKDSPYISILRFTSTFGISSSVESNHGFYLKDIEVWGSATKTANGQVLVDFTGQNYPYLDNVRLWQAGTGILLAKGSAIECNYGTFNRVDVNQCDIGINVALSTPASSNSHSFFSGRMWDNNTALKIALLHSNINCHGTVFESNDVYGVDSEGTNCTFSGCRFENASATNIHLGSGAGNHYSIGCHWSSGFSIVDDTQDGMFFVFDKAVGTATNGTAYGGRFPVGIPNIFKNPYFEHDTSGNGEPDDWLWTFSSLGTATITLDPTAGELGDNAVSIQSGTGNNVRIEQTFQVVSGMNYTLTVKPRIDTSSARIRIGNSGSGSTEYANITFSNTSYAVKTSSFTTTSDTLNIAIFLDGTTNRLVEVDYVSLVAGILPNYGPVDNGINAIDGGSIYSDVIWRVTGTGPIVTSPDGTTWRITVDNAGALGTTSIVLPDQA